jgi:hypothetical protein
VRTLAVGQLGRNGVLDAGDNVFFLDRGAVKELETASGYAEEKVIANGAYKLNGSLAIDAQGDLFLATDDAVEEIRAEDGYARITTLTKGRYYFPHGMAADRAGNLFVADFPGRQVQQLLATGGYSQVKPIAVAADDMAYRAKRYLATLGIGSTMRVIGMPGSANGVAPGGVRTIGTPLQQTAPAPAH